MDLQARQALGDADVEVHSDLRGRARRILHAVKVAPATVLPATILAGVTAAVCVGCAPEETWRPPVRVVEADLESQVARVGKDALGVRIEVSQERWWSLSLDARRFILGHEYGHLSARTSSIASAVSELHADCFSARLFSNSQAVLDAGSAALLALGEPEGYPSGEEREAIVRACATLGVPQNEGTAFELPTRVEIEHAAQWQRRLTQVVLQVVEHGGSVAEREWTEPGERRDDALEALSTGLGWYCPERRTDPNPPPPDVDLVYTGWNRAAPTPFRVSIEMGWRDRRNTVRIRVDRAAPGGGE